MSDDELTPERIAALTAAADIEASPPDGEPVALLLFGTNQTAPAQIAAARYHAGAAPLVIATGGVNRHDGIIEGREFARQLTEAGVPGDVIRVEDQSKNTWQNVELSLPHLREALAMGLRLAVVSKWYHLRTVYCLATLLPEAAPFHAISWEPVYAGTLVTRASWPKIPDGRRRVLRELQEVPRRVTEGTYRAARKADGAWQLSCRPGDSGAAVSSCPQPMEAPFLRLSENFCSPWSTHVFQPRCVLLTRSLPAIMNCQLPTMVISPQTIAFIEMIMVSPAAS